MYQNFIKKVYILLTEHAFHIANGLNVCVILYIFVSRLDITLLREPPQCIAATYRLLFHNN